MQMLCDQRLSDGARVIGLRIAALGDDLHELAPDDFSRMVAGFPKQETIAKHLRQLEILGYIERKPGGRAHSDRFRFLFSAEENAGPKKDSPLQNAGANDLAPENMSDLNTLVVGEEEDVRRKPPISPLRCELDEKAKATVDANAGILAGCRGSMRDYLAANVPMARQYAYVQSVVGWLNDINPAIWALPDGGWLEKPKRTPLLAEAFNDLGASDERVMKRPVGDIANLQTKLNYLLRKRSNGKRTGNNGSTGTDTGRIAAEGGGTAVPDQTSRRRRGFGDHPDAS